MADQHNPTAEQIRLLARRYQVAYAEGPGDRLAHDMSRLAGDAIELDEIERLLIGLHRAGHLSRTEMIRLQAQYLRETRRGLRRGRPFSEVGKLVEPRRRRSCSLDEMVAQCDASVTPTDDEWEWLDAPRAGREII
jgi:hypothetical protein